MTARLQQYTPQANTLRLMNDGIKNELDTILLFTMMVATIQAPFSTKVIHIPRLSPVLSTRQPQYACLFQGLKATPRIQGFHS